MSIESVNARGLFVVFEGGEGSGKSTQSQLLHETLQRHGIPAFLTREPGGHTNLGMALRALLMDSDTAPKTKKAELLMFLADRAEHVERVIKPRLEEGVVVICDRYQASTLAYQAHAGGLNESAVEQFSAWASEGLLPDVTYFLDVDAYVGLQRSMRVSANHYEGKDLEYHETVRRSFQYQYQQNQRTWQKFDSRDGVDGVHRLVVSHFIGLYHGLRDPLKNFIPKNV